MVTESTARLWAHPAFVRFWLARVAGNAANQIQQLALGWQMYDLTSSAWDLGLVGLCQFGPSLLMTLPAGHLADRWHRGRIFAAMQGLQGLVALAMVLACASGTVSRELIFVLSGLMGLARAFQMPAQQALTPLLVPASLLPQAVTLSTSGMQAAVIGGPALGGLLYAWGAPLVYASCTVLFAVALLLMAGVRYAHQPARGSSAPTLATLLAGLTFVGRHKLLLGAASLDLFAVLLGGATALLPIYARDILHTGPAGLGLLRSAPAVGALLVSFWLMRHPLQRRVGRTLLLSVAVFGLATLVFGVSRHFGLSLLALAVTGAADNISVVVRITLAQLETPDEMRGRVAAVNSIFIGASNQLGEFESGATAALLGPVGSVVLGGLGTLLVAALWWRMFPALAQRDRLVPPPA
jgi:MFS family permease